MDDVKHTPDLLAALDAATTHLIVLVAMVETNTLPESLRGFHEKIDQFRTMIAIAKATGVV